MNRQTSEVLNVLDAAYVLEGGDTQWLRRVVASAHGLLGQGLGMSGYFVEATSDGFEAWDVQTAGTDDAAERAIFERWREHAPTALKRHAHLYRPAVFASQLPPGNLAREAFEQSFELTGRADILGITALDSAGRGVAFAIPYTTRQTESPAAPELILWERVAAHVAAAIRLRRRLHTGAHLEPEAVISAKGRLEHAEGDAKQAEAAQALREAARRFDDARTPNRAADPLEATQWWRAVVAGRWSLTDRFESDGRRYIVARPNTPHVDPWSLLSAREAQAVRAAALGHSNKMIAYELGLSQSTVSTCLSQAAAKLGFPNQVALIHEYAAWLADPPR